MKRRRDFGERGEDRGADKSTSEKAQQSGNIVNENIQARSGSKKGKKEN